MNKKGKGKAWVVPVLVILIVGMLAVAIYGIYSLKPTEQEAIGPQTNTGGGATGGTYISTGATTLSFVGSDALQPGTSVTPTTQISIDGSSFYGTNNVTTASPRNVLEILATATGYHAVRLTGKEVPAAPTFPISVPLYGNASITVTMFSTNNVVLTNGGGAQNQTVTAGGAYTIPFRFDGQDKKSTDEMRCVLETTSGTNTSTIVMSSSDLSPVLIGQNKPSIYTLQGTGSAVYVYDISPVTGAVSKNGQIQIVSNTGKTLAQNKLLLTCYAKEWFIDSTTGKATFGIEDSTGTAKYQAAYTYTVQFV